MRKIYFTICICVLVLAFLTFFGTQRIMAQEDHPKVVYSTLEVKGDRIQRIEFPGRKAQLMPNRLGPVLLIGSGAAITFSIATGWMMRKKMLQF